MIETHSVLTLTLAKALGVYMIAAGLGGLAQPGRWRVLLDEIKASAAITYLAAVAAFAVGVTLVIIHNRWTDPLAIIITLVGWAALLEGVLLLARPTLILSIGDGLMKYARAFAIIAILAGACLLAAGLLGRASISA